MIDSHCHLTHHRLTADADAVVARAREAGMVACISIGTGLEDARRVRELCRSEDGFVYGTAGLDPFTAHEAGDRFDEDLAGLSELLRGGGFCALGEVGLDYHYDLDPRPLQAARLEAQLDLAEALDLPVVIHVRDAHDDMAALLDAHPRARGVIHSFTAGPREAEAYLDLDWHLAFNGVITFRNGEDAREAARRVPQDRLLVETDSPYLAPVPYRGKRCEPAYVVETVRRLAEVRGETVESVALSTARNAASLFRLDA